MKGNKSACIQLSLFEYDLRDMSDEQLISKLAGNTPSVSETWEGTYSVSSLLNALTPAKRKIAAAAIELYRRGRGKLEQSAVIKSSVDADRIFRPILADLEVEEFWILPMNSRCSALRPVRISSGTIDETCVDVRIIIRKLIEAGATRFVAVHNHPSGSVNPSQEDIRLTKRIEEAGKMMNIRLLDHLIISYCSYYSFADNGLVG